MRFSEQGISLWYGTGDAPAPVGEVEAASGSEEALVSITAAVQPPSASNSVEVTYRVNGGSPATVSAALLSHDLHQQAQYFQIKLPPFHVGDTVDYLVVAHAPGHQVPQQGGQFTSSFRVVPDPPPPKPFTGTLPHLTATKSLQLRTAASAAGLSAPPVQHLNPAAVGLLDVGAHAVAPSSPSPSSGEPASASGLPERSEFSSELASGRYRYRSVYSAFRSPSIRSRRRAARWLTCFHTEQQPFPSSI
jgi:hypothetical protein